MISDNNKQNRAEQEHQNQSTEIFVAETNSKPKSKHTGDKHSEESPKTADQDANRNQSLKDDKKKKHD
jgi:hypothetical protein